MIGHRISIGRLVGCVLACLTLMNPARAVAAETAEELVMKGLKLRRQDQHERALELFQRAHAQEPSPMTFAQMGIAEQSLKRWADAEVHLSAALDQPNFPFIRKNRHYIEQALDTVRRHIGQIDVRGTPGAGVHVNGRYVGNLPLPAPIRVSEGAAEVRVTAAGHTPVIRTVTIQPGATLVVDAILQPISAPATQTTAQLQGARSDKADGETGWPRGKIAGVALLATSVAALAGGVAFLLADGKGACDRPADGECVENYTTKVQGWALVGTGVAASAVGGVLLYRSSRTQIAVGLNASSLFAIGRF